MQDNSDLNSENNNLTTLPKETAVATTNFVKIEKDLIALGFFTPSSKKIRGAKKKTIAYSRVVNGKKVDGFLHIIPSAEYGLPITADLDKYLAIKQLIRDLNPEGGVITNPTIVSSAEINRVMGKQARQGKNNQTVLEFLKRLFHTGIEFEAVDLSVSKKPKVLFAVHILEKLIAYGETLPDGQAADKHYLWWSEWLLEQINANRLLPIEYEEYKLLKNHTAKVLVPLLQIWLFASQEQGTFEKRYDELCQFLKISEYSQFSRIEEQLKPALDELLAHGYLASWQVEKTSDRKSWKIVFNHGEKFYKDQELRKEKKGKIEQQNQQLNKPNSSVKRNSPKPSSQTIKSELNESKKALIPEFTKRKFTELEAELVLARLPENQDILTQLEYGDDEIQRRGQAIESPTGLYVHLLNINKQIPSTFESPRIRKQKEAERRAQEVKELEEKGIIEDHKNFTKTQVEKYITEHLSLAEYEELIAAKTAIMVEEHSDSFLSWPEHIKNGTLRNEIHKEIRLRINLPTLDQYRDQQQQTEQGAKPQELPQEPVSEQNTLLGMASQTAADPEPNASADISQLTNTSPEPELIASNEPIAPENAQPDPAPSPESNDPVSLIEPEQTLEEVAEQNDITPTTDPDPEEEPPARPAHNELPTQLL